MDRLTIPDVPIDGGMKRAIIDARAVRQQAMTIYWKLKEYEDLEERLQSIYGECNGLLGKVVEHLERHEGVDLLEPVVKARLLTDGEVDRWEEYKKLEEQRKLLKLPCAMGNMTYWADKLYGRVRDAIVERIEIDSDGFWVITSSGTHSFDDFGKTVFLTRGEAETALHS